MSGHEHGDHSGCNLDDDDHLQLLGQRDFLFDKIDLPNVTGLNELEPGMGKAVIKPWDERNSEDKFLESDADEQLVLQIPFTGTCKLRSILIKAGPTDQTPSEVKIFANETLDFDEASFQEATQTIQLPISREVVEYPLKPAKFPSVHRITLFFPSNHGAETSRVYFVGLRGDFSVFTRDPVITVYEAQANPADHAKVKGLEENMHSRIG